MSDLSQLMSAVMIDIAHAQFNSDIEFSRLAEESRGDEIRSKLPNPRFFINGFNYRYASGH